jgi:ubiquinone biosynthesis protein COQ9
MTSDDPNMTSDSESEVTSDSEASSDEDGTRTAVLEAALLHVPSLGWTVAALEEGVKDLGLTEAAQDLFSRGAGELIDHFEVTSNSDLVDYLKKTIEHENVKGSELMMDAVEQRLRMIIPYINRWPQAMALKAFPSNAPTALENLALMVDDIWYYAGDRSTDFSWYTKRTILAALYSSTGVYTTRAENYVHVHGL